MTMNSRITAIALSALLATAATDMSAQSYTHISSTQGNEWSSTKGKMEKKPPQHPCSKWHATPRVRSSRLGE